MEETIVAIATPPGEGGIGIIRLSGKDSKKILESVFPLKKPIVPRMLTYGFVKDPEKNEVIDEALCVYMPAPATYTKEDVVEINCHGGPAPLSKTLDLLLRKGARLAEPGEFTKRAFLNGRIDLSQAEAVLDVITSKTDASLEAAIAQLQGKFSQEISVIRSKLVDILVNVDVNIDYPDEDIEELTYQKLREGLLDVKEEIGKLLEGAKAGKILREGLNVAIIGKPNAGKSSLLNLLLRESRAIVTDIPGTTRDTIQEFANIKGIPVKLTDTAGIRETEDAIERIGIERSKKSIEEADLIILMVDLSQALDQEGKNLIREVDPKKTLLIYNKEDKDPKLTNKDFQEIETMQKDGFAEILTLSLMDDGQIKKVEEAIFRLSGYGGYMEGTGKSGNLVTNVRHKNMLENALYSIGDAIEGAKAKAPLELIEIDVREAYEELGFITGDSVQGDIINEIFSRFCLGK